MMGSTVKYSITPRQRRVYEFIRMYINKYEKAPSYREICDGCGIQSLSNITQILRSLRKRNWIDYLDGEARSIIIK